MAVYYINLGLLSVFAFLERYLGLRSRVSVACAVALALGLFAGLRLVGVDNDSATYSYVFDIVSNSDFHLVLNESRETSQEPGFLLFLKLVYNLGGSYAVAQLLLNACNGIALAALLNRVSPRPIFGVLLYYLLFYYFRDFTQLRFSVASVLGMWALYFWIVESRRMAAGVVFALAVSFHNSAIILLLPALLLRIRLHESPVRIAVVAATAIALGLVKVTTSILVYVFELPEQVVRYIDTDDGGRAGMLSIVLGLVISLFIIGDRKEPLKPVDLLMFYGLFASFVAGIVFSDLVILLRMQLLLFTAVIICPGYFRGLYGKALIAAVVGGALYTNLININEALMRPYETWLFK